MLVKSKEKMAEMHVLFETDAVSCKDESTESEWVTVAKNKVNKRS